MGSIIKKKIKNKVYYYYVESKRVNGKPRYVNQKYLGNAESLLNKLASMDATLQNQVLFSNVSEFGAVTLLYDIASRLDIAGIIDGTAPKRKQGASIGTYILTAAINRAVAPKSTSGLQEWYSSTCLPTMTGICPNAFTPQNFWNNTCLDEATINNAENAILRKTITAYKIDTQHIIYDATNFFTYIDTNQDSKLAKRGHSKEKRNDLRIIGLSMMVTPDCNIPLLHEAYPGNRHDSVQFRTMMEKLKSRYEYITGKASDVTVVFDRGNNSKDNIEFLEDEIFKIHYVGGLTKAQAKELFEVPLTEYTPLVADSLNGQMAYRSQMNVFDREVTALIVFNPELEAGQLQGIRLNMEKTEARLAALKQRLMKRAESHTARGKKVTVESVTKNVEDILKTEYMKDIFTYEVTEQEGGICFTYNSSDEALERVRLKHLGRTVFFTDRHDFTNEEIVSAYRSAWHVESAFKQLKNTEHLSVRPVFHWTDDKIRVHIFTCVLAYRLCCLLAKELSEKGINVNINQLLEIMSGIKQVTTFFGDINKPETVKSFTKGSDLAEQIENVYQLKGKYKS